MRIGCCTDGKSGLIGDEIDLTGTKLACRCSGVDLRARATLMR
jgi:hypothetical protein